MAYDGYDGYGPGPGSDHPPPSAGGYTSYIDYPAQRRCGTPPTHPATRRLANVFLRTRLGQLELFLVRNAPVEVTLEHQD